MPYVGIICSVAGIVQSSNDGLLLTDELPIQFGTDVGSPAQSGQIRFRIRDFIAAKSNSTADDVTLIRLEGSGDTPEDTLFLGGYRGSGQVNANRISPQAPIKGDAWGDGTGSMYSVHGFARVDCSGLSTVPLSNEESSCTALVLIGSPSASPFTLELACSAGEGGWKRIINFTGRECRFKIAGESTGVVLPISTACEVYYSGGLLYGWTSTKVDELVQF